MVDLKVERNQNLYKDDRVSIDRMSSKPVMQGPNYRLQPLKDLKMMLYRHNDNI